MKYLEKHPIIMIIVAVLGASLSAIFVRHSTAPSAVTAALRLMWAVLLMTPYIFGKKAVRQELLSISKKTLILSCISGVFLAIHFSVWFESLRHTSVASSTTIVCTEVIWVALGFCLFMKGKIPKQAIAAIAITLAGSVLIAYADSVAGEMHLYGDFLSLLAAFAVAVYMLIGRVVREQVSTGVYTYIVYIACGVTLIGICLVQGHNIFGFGMNSIIIGLLLAIFPTILGHSLFSWSLKYFSPSFVSASKLCEPVVASVIAAFLFGELPSWLQLLGGIIIIGGVYYYSRIEQKANKALEK